MLRRSLTVAFLSIVFGLLVVSCGVDGPTAPEADEFTGIAPGKGVDGVTFGMSIDRVEAVLGGPEERDTDSSGHLEYIYSGMVITFTDAKDPVVEGILLVEGYTGKTAAGIGIGSTRDEVHAAHGKPKKSGYLGGNESIPADDYTTIGMRLMYVLDVYTRYVSTFTYDAFGRPTEHRKLIDSADNSQVSAIWIYRLNS